MNEDTVVLLAKEGKEDAFNRLYQDNCQRVYRLAYGYVRSPEDAEDVMQETFIRAFKSIQSYQISDNTSFSSWLHRICINCSIGQLRKMKRLKRYMMISLDDMTIDPAGEDNSPEAKVELGEILSLIRKAVSKLSPKQQVVFNLRYRQDLSIKDIAELLRCHQNTVKTQLWRSIRKLRERLAPLWREL
ncbi:MAG: sigma-70 family RNA polymerase sigma factor [candidate division Zixibacteria bacterium]|nr:sigma-70 family RNA polymerase sigma factor [candidate division Zixibacteria bacterium]